MGGKKRKQYFSCRSDHVVKSTEGNQPGHVNTMYESPAKEKTHGLGSKTAEKHPTTKRLGHLYYLLMHSNLNWLKWDLNLNLNSPDMSKVKTDTMYIFVPMYLPNI